MFRLYIIALATVIVVGSISPCLAQDTTQAAPDTSQALETTATTTPTAAATQTETDLAPRNRSTS